MHRAATATAILGLAALLSPPAAAHTFTEHFEELESELEHRRDDDLSGELDRTGKKRLKAVLKSLALLEKEADDLGDDVKTAGKISKLLEKAFPGEMEAAAHDGNLGAMLRDLGEDLESEVATLGGQMSEGLGELSDKGRARVEKALDKGQALIEGLGDPLPGKTFYRGLQKAYKAMASARKAVDRDPGSGESSVAITIDGDDFTGPENAKAEVHAAGNGLAVSCSFPDGSDDWYLVLFAQGVTGTGTFPLDSGGASAFLNFVPSAGDQVGYDGVAGATITVTTFNKKSRIAGTFQFTGMNSGGGTVTVSGSFDIGADDIERY